MGSFLRFFVGFDLCAMLMWLAFLPLLLVPVAPLVWLLMVAIGVAPMTWAGLLFNWIILSVMFAVYLIYRRIQANWRLFQAIRAKGGPLTVHDFMKV